MWLRIRRGEVVHWVNLGRVGVVTFDYDECVIRVSVSDDVGLYLTKEPGVEFYVFKDDWEAMQLMVEDYWNVRVHPVFQETEGGGR